VYEVIQPLDNANTPPEELKPLLHLLPHGGYITNQNIRETLGLDRKADLRFAERMVSLGWLEQEGEGCVAEMLIKAAHVTMYTAKKKHFNYKYYRRPWRI